MSKQTYEEPSMDGQELSTASEASTIGDHYKPSNNSSPFEHKHCGNTRRPSTHRRISDMTYLQQPKRQSTSPSTAGDHSVAFKHNPVVIIDAYEIEQNNDKNKRLIDYICCCCNKKREE